MEMVGNSWYRADETERVLTAMLKLRTDFGYNWQIASLKAQHLYA